ncbi:hypothetical protein YC2023_045436 [Brassica napus]
MGFGQTFARERRLLEKSSDGRLLKKSSLEKSNIVNCKSNPADFLLRGKSSENLPRVFQELSKKSSKVCLRSEKSAYSKAFK